MSKFVLEFTKDKEFEKFHSFLKSFDYFFPDFDISTNVFEFTFNKEKKVYNIRMVRRKKIEGIEESINLKEFNKRFEVGLPKFKKGSVVLIKGRRWSYKIYEIGFNEKVVIYSAKDQYGILSVELEEGEIEKKIYGNEYDNKSK